MSVICKFCGRELADGAGFCDGCGAIVEDDRITCLSCGEKLEPGTTLCPVCGARIYNTSAADGPAEMEALVPPVITDDMFASSGQEYGAPADIEAADESQFMASGVQRIPEPAVPAPSPAQSPVPPPAPVPERPRVNFTPKPQVAPLLNRPHRPASEQEPQPAPVINETYRQPTAQPYPQQQLFQQQAYTQGQFEEAARPMQPDPYQQPPHSPYPDPRQMRVEKGQKGHSLVVPIILIILIVAVILVDVFVLFRDRIFGSDDKSSKKSISVVTLLEDGTDT